MTPRGVPELEALRRIPGLEAGPTVDLIALGDLSGRCVLEAGQVLYGPGRAPRHVLLIASGAIEVRRPGRAPAHLGPGQLVGVRALRLGDGHDEEAVVAERTEVLAVRAEVADRLLALPSVDRLLRRAPARGATISGDANERRSER